MDIYAVNDLTELLRSNPYPGRGIVLGQTPDGKHAVTAYFIMGRSANSRNRIFVRSPTASARRPMTPPSWKIPASSSTIPSGSSAGA